jgi:hypothetical protein
MDPVSLGVPESIVDSLPEDDGSAAADMQQAVAGLETQLNRAIEDAADDGEAAEFAVDVIERLEDHYERYDEFVPELRAWGQSPIYAISWRNLQASLIRQVQDHEGLAAHVDRERNYRLVEDGIRFGQR